jgi:hypothetical protein
MTSGSFVFVFYPFGLLSTGKQTRLENHERSNNNEQLTEDGCNTC